MSKRYYTEIITDISQKELKSIFQSVEPPICLLGGWAVHLQVNEQFQEQHGRRYIGSRDIDLGVHIGPTWNSNELSYKPVGKSIREIRDLGYTESRFGFMKIFRRKDQQLISEKEAENYGMHELFQLYIDIVPDNSQLESFKEKYGFKPPAEPLLQPVFEKDKAEPLDNYVSWNLPQDILVVKPELLGAMKIKSVSRRKKSHKQIKDIADLHALLWYIKDLQNIKKDIHKYVSDKDLEKLKQTVNKELFKNAASLLGVETGLIQDSITQIIKK